MQVMTIGVIFDISTADGQRRYDIAHKAIDMFNALREISQYVEQFDMPLTDQQGGYDVDVKNEIIEIIKKYGIKR